VYFTDKITQARDIYHIFKEEKGVEGGEGESFWIEYLDEWKNARNVVRQPESHLSDVFETAVF
jgi:hypothetical protein